MYINIKSKALIIDVSIISYKYKTQKYSLITNKDLYNMQITNRCVIINVIIKINFSKIKILI